MLEGAGGNELGQGRAACRDEQAEVALDFLERGENGRIAAQGDLNGVVEREVAQARRNVGVHRGGMTARSGHGRGGIGRANACGGNEQRRTGNGGQDWP